MYEYDYMLNGKESRDALQQKIHEAEEWRLAH